MVSKTTDDAPAIDIERSYLLSINLKNVRDEHRG
jgi:hypothetical protein